MKNLLCVLLFLVTACGASNTDAVGYLGLTGTGGGGGVTYITPSVTVSRSSGTAPLYVFFDASATTDSDSTACPSCDTFRDLQYTWTFADTGSAWTYGTRTGANSTNTAYGPVAAHVFAAAGTYAVTLTVTDGTNTTSSYAAGTITVADPDTTYASTATTCYSASGTFTNCPSGATQTTSSNYITGTLSSGHRYLFHCGETFSAGSSTTITSTSAGQIGAYDCSSAAQPVVNATANSVSFAAPGGSAPADWTIFGLNFKSNSHSGVYVANNSGSVVPTNFLYYDNTADSLQGFAVLDFASPSQNLGFVGNVINTSNNESIYGWAKNEAILGNLWSHTGTSATYINIIRTMGSQKMAISNNTFEHFDNTSGSSLGTWISVRVHDTAGSQQAGYAVISENDITSGGNFGMNTGAPVYTDTGEYQTELIIEKNWIKLDGPNPGPNMYLDGKYVDVRDNILNCTGVTGNTNCINVYPQDQHGGSSDGGPQYFRVYNNTMYSSSSGALWAIAFTGATSPIIKNNLVYAPSATNQIINSSSTTGLTESNNTCGTGATTSCAGGPTTDPTFTNGSGTYSLATDFQPNTGSYAIGAGATVPNLSDFFGTTWVGGWDIGGVHH